MAKWQNNFNSFNYQILWMQFYSVYRNIVCKIRRKKKGWGREVSKEVIRHQADINWEQKECNEKEMQYGGLDKGD